MLSLPVTGLVCAGRKQTLKGREMHGAKGNECMDGAGWPQTDCTCLEKGGWEPAQWVPWDHPSHGLARCWHRLGAVFRQPGAHWTSVGSCLPATAPHYACHTVPTVQRWPGTQPSSSHHPAYILPRAACLHAHGLHSQFFGVVSLEEKLFKPTRSERHFAASLSRGAKPSVLPVGTSLSSCESPHVRCWLLLRRPGWFSASPLYSHI